MKSSVKKDQLLRVYQDLERTLRALRSSAEKGATLESIDVRKLIDQLTRSKRRLERKIGNTILLEKQSLERKFKKLLTS